MSAHAYARIQSPVGDLHLVASRLGIHSLSWSEPKDIPQNFDHPILKKAVRQLEEYFEGRRTQFDLPLAPQGTEFQMKVWEQLRKIPYGQTISYGEQARRLGDANKARAVGTANSQNPIAIIVPCHRVIAATGAISGFGGGVENKRILLALEQGQRLLI